MRLVQQCLAAVFAVTLSISCIAQTIRVTGDNNYPPYLFLGPDGKPQGYLVDLWRLWEQKTGVRVELTPTDWASAQQRINTGRADVIEMIFDTPQRRSLYDYTAPYAAVQVAIYTDENITGIASATGLRGFVVGVERGDACADRLKQAGVRTTHQYTTYSEVIAAAQAKDIRIFCMDKLPASYYLYRAHAQNQFVEAFDFYIDSFHRGVRKGDRGTLELVERGMALITPEERTELREKWMGHPLDMSGYAGPLKIVSATLTLAGIALVGWVYTLRRAVRRRTRELAFLSHYDPVTGLPNRQLLLDRINHAIAAGGSPIAVLLVDLDNFKRVNDNFGHPIGDELLKEAGARLKHLHGLIDSVARLSGDDFVLVVRTADVEQVTVVAQQVRQDLARAYVLDGKEVFVSASVGVSLFPADGQDGIALLKNADAAMFRAKQSGRNSIAFYSAALSAQATSFISLGASIRKAMEHNEFTLLYQPQCCLSTGRIRGVEALVRWRQDGRLIPPSDFIAYAEEHGLIETLGKWVLRAACLQLSSWLADGAPAVRMAVNLSPRQLVNPGFAETVEIALAEACIPASLLELEITEGAVVHQDQATEKVLRDLRALGVDIAIDDFGTGYSSLGYVNHLPVSVIKIDKSFLSGVPEEENAAQVITAIIAMAHAMKMRVVAEGVERPEQAAFLKEAGCDLAQGWLYGRPMRPSDMAALLGRAV